MVAFLLTFSCWLMILMQVCQSRVEWRGERSSHYAEVRFSGWDWTIIKKDVALLITPRRGRWKFCSAWWRGCFDFSGPFFTGRSAVQLLWKLCGKHICFCVGTKVIFRWWIRDRHFQKCLTKSADNFNMALFWTYELFSVFLVVSQSLLCSISKRCSCVLENRMTLAGCCELCLPLTIKIIIIWRIFFISLEGTCGDN